MINYSFLYYYKITLHDLLGTDLESEIRDIIGNYKVLTRKAYRILREL